MNNHQPRLRSYSFDSYRLIGATESLRSACGSDRAARSQKLRPELLKMLNYDVVALGLALDRMEEVSNRVSAEKYGISASTANRKGRRAILILRAFALASACQRGIQSDGYGVAGVNAAGHVSPIHSGRFAVQAEATKTLRSSDGLKEIASFARKHRQQFGLDDESAGLEAAALLGWKTEKTVQIAVGVPVDSMDVAKGEIRMTVVLDAATGSISD